MRPFFVLLLLCWMFGSIQLMAQGELNATVKVNTPTLQKNDRRVFDQLESSLREFINNTKWSQDAFEPEERINCSFIITVSEELDNNAFKGEIAIQSTRRIFGSGYDSPLLSHLDKEFQFTYEQNQPIEFQPDAADNQNLAAIMAFYAYIILAMDYDSFSLYGGDPFLSLAQNLVTNIQNSSTNNTPGWRPTSNDKNRSRFWMIENLTSARVKPYRAAMYTYYRKGLDMLSINMDQAKTNVFNALEEVDKVNSAYFNSMIIQMFANAKRDEVVEMWKIGSKDQRERIMQIMTKMDPANGGRYREIGG
ncbi:MAG: DUF4835 family protein [Bacteroidetes bacterium]|nr:DUF4835 family protein [Bacteroidota bacterium]